MRNSAREKHAFGQRADHLFHLRRDHVSLREFGILKEIAHQALGEQMLDEHFVNFLSSRKFGG